MSEAVARTAFDDRDDVLECGPFGLLTGASTAAIASGVRKRLNRRGFRMPGPTVRMITLGGARSRPRRQSHAVSQASRQCEEIDDSCVPQFGHGLIQGAIEVGQIRGDVVTAEQRGRQGAPAVEDLIGKLASEHQVIGNALTGFLLGKPIERFDARGGEGEQVVIVGHCARRRCHRGERAPRRSRRRHRQPKRPMEDRFPRRPGAPEPEGRWALEAGGLAHPVDGAADRLFGRGQR